MSGSSIVSTITAMALGGPDPRIHLDTHGAMAIGDDPHDDGGRHDQIAAYAAALRVGDRVRWRAVDGAPGQIAWVRHPRPSMDRITLEWLRRAGADPREVAREGRGRATVWHHPSVTSWMHMYGGDQGVNLAPLLGEVRLSHMTGHPGFIELRGPYLIADLDFLPETVKTAMIGDACAGRRIGDLIDGLDEHCGMTGDEIVASMSIHDDGDFHSTSIHLAAGDPIPLADLLQNQ